MIAKCNIIRRPKGWLTLALALVLALQLICIPALATVQIENEEDYADMNCVILDDELPEGGQVQTAEDYRKWAQGDPRWGSIRLGSNGRTVAEAGCLVTSITKLIIQSGYRNPEEFNVATLVNWLNANNGLSSVGNLYWNKPPEMIDGF